MIFCRYMQKINMITTNNFFIIFCRYLNMHYFCVIKFICYEQYYWQRKRN